MLKYSKVFTGILLVATTSSSFALTPDETQKIVDNALRELIANQLTNLFGDEETISFRRIDNDGSSLKDGYAVDYDWKKSFTKDHNTNYQKLLEEKGQQLYYGSSKLDVFAKGSYAWDDADNNEDLSKFGISASFVTAFTPSPDNSGMKVAMTDCLNKANAQMAADPNANVNHLANICYQEYAHDLVKGQESYAFDFGGHYHVEGNQDFTDKQNAYGAHISAAYSPHNQSQLKWLNIPDWLFMGSRWFFNDEKPLELNSYSASFPTVTVKYEQVDPIDNDPRKALDKGEDEFERFVFISAFNTKVATYEGQNIVFDWTYQRYLEDGAPESVKNARLDDFEFNSYSLLLPVQLFGAKTVEGKNRLFVRYSKGDLPLDLTSNSSISIGWETDLDSLFKVLE